MGDSRAYIIGEQIKQITRDHSMVQEMLDKGLITEQESLNHPKKNILTRALGIESDVVPDFFEAELDGTTLVLFSDGLTDSLSDEEIKGIVMSTASLAGC